MTHLLETLGQDVVVFAFCASVLFMAGYTVMAKWWRTELGWARISLDFGIAMALSPTMIHLGFGLRVEDSAGFAWYQIGAVAFVGLVCLWNLYLVAKIQFPRRKKKDR